MKLLLQNSMKHCGLRKHISRI